MHESLHDQHVRSEIVRLIPAVRAFTRRFCHNTADADDLVQETLLKALANTDKFVEGTNLKSWLFTIMRNLFCTRFHVARRESPGVYQCVSDERVFQPSQEWSLLFHEVERAYAELPEPYRRALGAVAVHGKSYEVAAAESNCAVGTVKSRLNRARHRLIGQFGNLTG